MWQWLMHGHGTGAPVLLRLGQGTGRPEWNRRGEGDRRGSVGRGGCSQRSEHRLAGENRSVIK
jgi:hypothetical protein